MDVKCDRETLAGAQLCFALASRLLYCEPDDAELTMQMEEHLFAEAPFGIEHPQVCEGLAAMDAWCADAATESPDARSERFSALRREWFRLFVGAGTPDAPSWESYYTDPNSQLFSVRTLEVRAWYQRYGLELERLHAELDDNLGLMLGFVSHLIDLEGEAMAAGDEARARTLADDEETFMTEHILPWLSAWRYSALKHATSAYFRGLVAFVFGLCACYAERFGVVFDEDAQAFKRAIRWAERAEGPIMD